MNTSPVRPYALGLLAAITLSSACATSVSSNMKETKGAATPTPASDSSTVVFFRPSSMIFKVTFPLIDEEAHYYGDISAQSYVVARIPAGKHLLISANENVAVVDAELEAGKVYYVEVVPEQGAGAAQVALRPRKPADMTSHKQWLAKATLLELDPAKKAKHEETFKAGFLKQIERAKDKLSRNGGTVLAADAGE